VESYPELKGLLHVIYDHNEATDAERQYVSAILTRTLEGAAYNLALSSGKRLPLVVREKLKDRYDPSRQVSVNSVWRKVNRRQIGNNDTRKHPGAGAIRQLIGSVFLSTATAAIFA